MSWRPLDDMALLHLDDLVDSFTEPDGVRIDKAVSWLMSSVHVQARPHVDRVAIGAGGQRRSLMRLLRLAV